MPTLSMTPSASRPATPRSPELRFRSFCERRTSTVGLGACREPGAEDASAMALAIRLGCNVLDTAPHYHQGAHEQAVGEAVRIAVTAHVCDRASLIVSTKVGRVPELVANNKVTLGFARLKALIDERYIAPGLFTWDELAHSDHTFAPAFIRHSVERSLERMGLDQLDCVFLDTPELQLRVASPGGFARRMLAAFEALEGLCASGQVRSYGISTGTTVDLRMLAELARTAAGSSHHFRALQVPLSLLRPDMLASRMLARAADEGLYVYARGCLDGGTPSYQIPDALAAALGDLPDASAAIRWVESAPFVGTALFGSRDARHVRANLAAAGLPPLDPALYDAGTGDS